SESGVLQRASKVKAEVIRDLRHGRNWLAVHGRYGICPSSQDALHHCLLLGAGHYIEPDSQNIGFATIAALLWSIGVDTLSRVPIAAIDCGFGFCEKGFVLGGSLGIS